MKITTILTAAALTLVPVLGSACQWQEKQAMTCAEGSAYDADTHSCKVVTG